MNHFRQWIVIAKIGDLPLEENLRTLEKVWMHTSKGRVGQAMAVVAGKAKEQTRNTRYISHQKTPDSIYPGLTIWFDLS